MAAPLSFSRWFGLTDYPETTPEAFGPLPRQRMGTGKTPKAAPARVDRDRTIRLRPAQAYLTPTRRKKARPPRPWLNGPGQALATDSGGSAGRGKRPRQQPP